MFPLQKLYLQCIALGRFLPVPAFNFLYFSSIEISKLGQPHSILHSHTFTHPTSSFIVSSLFYQGKEPLPHPPGDMLSDLWAQGEGCTRHPLVLI